MRQTAQTANLTKSAAPMSFGSFECAMVVMAPRCTHCNCRIAGTVVRSGTGAIYCGTQCARQSRART
jgi:glutamate/tyrosine decarboxylase-like PLP-dependent enzyme